jgi:7,8-dihydropterin-6-yl-methyl-4-(beta-D-ribofuranosyl)aminobenzene 5'-phosphate synthase
MLDEDKRIRVLGISRVDLPPVDRLRVTVLVDDSVSPEKRNLAAKHGLSFFIETSVAGEENRILMEAGPPPDIALQNANTIGADLQQIDTIVISHGHYDHTGGLIGILKHTRRQIAVVIHPQAFIPKFALSPKLRFIGLDLRDQESVIASGGVPLIARNPVRISRGVMTSGEVTRLTDYEKSEGFWKVEDERFVEDQVTDEQALLVNIKDKGLAVVTGCAHPGITNILNHSKNVSKIDDICAIIGGLHLAGASDERLQATTDELLRVDPELVCPCHCTGSTAINRFSESLGSRCKPIRTGDTIEL